MRKGPCGVPFVFRQPGALKVMKIMKQLFALFALFALVVALAPAGEARAQDAGPDDAGLEDAGLDDAGLEDAGTDDAGSDDAGPASCTPTCEGSVLTFCDESAAVTLDCTGGDVEGAVRCGVISTAFGADCILGAGAPCDPDYAFGLSRCDRAAGLFCIAEVCTAAEGPVAPPPLEPTPGSAPQTTPEDEETTTDPFGCGSCSESSSSAAFLGGALLLALRPLRRRAAREQRRR